jgi:hypothetical protein
VLVEPVEPVEPVEVELLQQLAAPERAVAEVEPAESRMRAVWLVMILADK